MKPFREGHKVLHEESCNNQELPFQIWRDSNYFCSHKEKKNFFFAEGALFGRFQVPHNSPNIMILIFLVSYIMKHPQHWIQAVVTYIST